MYNYYFGTSTQIDLSSPCFFVKSQITCRIVCCSPCTCSNPSPFCVHSFTRSQSSIHLQLFSSFPHFCMYIHVFCENLISNCVWIRRFFSLRKWKRHVNNFWYVRSQLWTANGAQKEGNEFYFTLHPAHWCYHLVISHTSVSMQICFLFLPP